MHVLIMHNKKIRQIHGSGDKNALYSPKDSFIDLFSGTCGAFVFVYLGQPLDTVKVKMQTFPGIYKNWIECLIATIQKEGIRTGLYAGTTASLCTSTAEFSVLFFTYGMCQKLLGRVFQYKEDQKPPVLDAAAGSTASFFSSLAITPTELVKCKLQAQREHLQQLKLLPGGSEGARVGPLEMVRNILQADGILGMYKGFLPTLAREMPGYFVYFFGYEGVREMLREQDQKKSEIGLLKTMLAGCTAGGLFWSSTYPVDVVKSRIQVTGIQQNMFKLAYNILRNEGVMALYAGLSPTLLRTMPANACLLATFEAVRTQLHELLD